MATRDGAATAGKRTRGNTAAGAAEGGGGYSPRAMKAVEKKITQGRQWAQKSLDCFDEAGKLLASGSPPGT